MQGLRYHYEKREEETTVYDAYYRIPKDPSSKKSPYAKKS